MAPSGPRHKKLTGPYFLCLALSLCSFFSPQRACLSPVSPRKGVQNSCLQTLLLWLCLSPPCAWDSQSAWFGPHLERTPQCLARLCW